MDKQLQYQKNNLTMIAKLLRNIKKHSDISNVVKMQP